MAKKNWLDEYNKELTEKIDSLSKEKASLDKEYVKELKKYWSFRDGGEKTDKEIRDQYKVVTNLLDKKDSTERELNRFTIERDAKYMCECLHSDVHAYEIIERKTVNVYLVRRLKAEITEESKKALQESFVPGGFCGHFDNDLQEWKFSSDESNPIIEIRKHKNGYFYRPNTNTPFVLRLEPYENFDYNF